LLYAVGKKFSNSSATRSELAKVWLIVKEILGVVIARKMKEKLRKKNKVI